MKTVEEARSVGPVETVSPIDKLTSSCRRRWEILSRHGKNTSDLRQAVGAEGSGNPCEDGLRSVFWKVSFPCKLDMRADSHNSSIN